MTVRGKQRTRSGRHVLDDDKLNTVTAVADAMKKISATDTEFALNTAAYISTRLDALRNEPYSHPIETADDVLKNKFADCGTKEFLFQNIMNAGGLETRRVGFENVLIQIGHSCTEVRIDGRWVFIDPGFGVYFSTSDNPDTPLSLAKARQLYPDIRVWRTRDPLFLGQPDEGYSLAWCEAETDQVVDPTHKQTISYVSSTYFTSRALCAEEIKRETVTVPVDLRKSDKVIFGRSKANPDRGLSNLHELDDGMFIPGLLYRLGRFEHGDTEHAFIVMVDEATDIEVRIRFADFGTGGELFATAEPIISPEYTPSYNPDGLGWRNRRVDVHGTIENRNVKALFKALPPFTTFRLSMPIGKFHAPISYVFERAGNWDD